MPGEIFEVGERVHYVPAVGSPENGIVKSVHPGGRTCAVVYKCNGDWANYQNYTGCSTLVIDLRKGWV